MKNGSTKERCSAEEKPMCSCPAQSCCVLTWSYFLSYGEFDPGGSDFDKLATNPPLFGFFVFKYYSLVYTYNR